MMPLGLGPDLNLLSRIAPGVLWIALLLAGGQGSRLGALTRDLAKPAVPFGGKYRIIDFSLSNCIHNHFRLTYQQWKNMEIKIRL